MSRLVHGLTVAAVGLALTVVTGAEAQAWPAAEQAATASAGQHAAHGQEKPPEPQRPVAAERDPASKDDLSTDDRAAQGLPPFIPRLTDDDRKAAFPDVKGHAVHDRAVHSFILLDQLEWHKAADGSGFNLDSKGWVGRDRTRVWLRAESESEQGRIGEAQAHVLYGRQFSRWWDVVGGIRQDFRPGPAQTWAAIGVQGLAPYWFEVEATAYVGAAGRTHARLEVEYELLLTNRLILQPLVEAEIVGKSDPEREVGAGLSTTEAGFRLRYAFRPEVAPYLGLVWSKKWGRTADLAEEAGEMTGGARFVTGVRLWF